MLLTEQLQTHPIADLIPSMSEEEYRGLVEDIKINGLIDPIYLFEGRILDGRHRYRACLELNIEPRFEEYQGDGPVAFVISRNLKRRHLTESQRAALAVELLPYIEKEARERQVKSGGEYGVLGGRGIKKGSEEYNEKVLQLQEQDKKESEDQNDKTNGDNHTGGDNGKTLEKKISQGFFEKGRSAELVARLVDTNQQYVKTAKKLSRQAPEVFEAVKEGKVNLAQAKKIAELPEGLRENVIEKIKDNGNNGGKNNIGKVIAEVRRSAVKEQPENPLLINASNNLITVTDRISIIRGDFREEMEKIPDESISLIFTDPPYDAEHIQLYEELASIAARKLKQGGSLIAYAGHYALPEILTSMSKHLRYWWMIALAHNHGARRLHGKYIFVHWKPLVWFVKGGRYNTEMVDDLIRGDKPAKEHHEWAQGLQEASYYIQNLTEPGELVVDPFAGSGTTLIAAADLGRRAIGFEIDSDRISAAIQRIKETETIDK
jgi:16S rRNA G966 N2-methylase RsmD